MIDAKELRIGNWVTNGEKNYTVDVNMLYDIFNSESFPISPIPLTPDILISAGFEQSEENKLYCLQVRDNLWLELDGKGHGFLTTNNGNYIIEDTLRIDFLHQLQNFIFAHKQKELEIKLPLGG